MRDGMITLRHDGFRKVREGITTIEEILHIAGDVHEAPESPSANDKPAAPRSEVTS